MSLSKILRSSFLIITACLVLTACATKKVSTVGNKIQGDVYIGMAHTTRSQKIIKYTSRGRNEISR